MRMTEEQYAALLAKRAIRGVVVGAMRREGMKLPKYRNRKVTDAEGNVHDSTKEYRRWLDLAALERAGNISQLRRQVSYPLVVPDKQGVPQLICTYIADAVYVEGAATIVEDCKSPPTRAKPEYRIKLKLMQACHGLQVREV